MSAAASILINIKSWCRGLFPIYDGDNWIRQGGCAQWVGYYCPSTFFYFLFFFTMTHLLLSNHCIQRDDACRELGTAPSSFVNLLSWCYEIICAQTTCNLCSSWVKHGAFSNAATVNSNEAVAILSWTYGGETFYLGNDVNFADCNCRVDTQGRNCLLSSDLTHLTQSFLLLVTAKWYKGSFFFNFFGLSL